jgi:protein-S-isoprenylcysteine O-methyltransferase Ste14
MAKPVSNDSDIPAPEPQWRLWHGLLALAGLSVVFALLVALDFAVAIGLIFVGLVFLGIQALLLVWVMHRLRQTAEPPQGRE